ncbi:PREDICTED: ghrelin O-acyltransferase [Nanorana parkeri]|uniref:ghrelin O-acyltransferase n=1 Tax=Nanorana parkeri TaxID=125878 RepID=UPI000853F5BF|nr:PREDICTED: ghrelin O-acyltransferase [Nanorana parkeri]
MDYIQVTFHRVAVYQMAAFPCALLYGYLCSSGHLPITLRYIYLLVGGVILACASMGLYAILIFIPALCFTAMFHIVSWESVHRWAFLLQMTWQTGCHLWLMYRQYYMEETMHVKLSIMISSLMLLTQKVTSLAMDLHERKMIFTINQCMKEKSFHAEWRYSILVILSYFMFFPALLGGPLCSFVEFQQKVTKAPLCPNFRHAWTLVRGFTLFMLLQVLRAVLLEKITYQCDLMDCRHLDCIYVMWSTVLIFKLTYYSHWLLDEALFHTAGFSIVLYSQAEVSDINIFTLETTNKISVFARTWNKSTAMWLRRLVYANCRTRPLLCTFAFSAWWHGLYPGQIFGFLCWALMLEADYRIHRNLDFISKPWYIRYLYKTCTWLQTQLIIAYVMAAIESRTLASVSALCFSYNSFFPIIYCISCIYLGKPKKG